MQDKYLFIELWNTTKSSGKVKMKKRLALAVAFAFSIIPFTSFADHLEPDENQIKKVESW